MGNTGFALADDWGLNKMMLDMVANLILGDSSFDYVNTCCELTISSLPVRCHFIDSQDFVYQVGLFSNRDIEALGMKEGKKRLAFAIG